MSKVSEVLSQYYKQVGPTFDGSPTLQPLDDTDIKKVTDAFVSDGYAAMTTYDALLTVSDMINGKCDFPTSLK